MTRPRATSEIVRHAALCWWRENGHAEELPPGYVLAVRGYYRDTMGQPGTNDYGIYDDALFVVTPGLIWPFNANTDPSRTGWNPNAGKFMARLRPGVWWFRRVFHRKGSPSGHMAFGQVNNPVTVDRLNQLGHVMQVSTGIFGINLHRGGDQSTSSEGCLTVPPAQWPEFFSTLDPLTDGERFRVILGDGPIA